MKLADHLPCRPFRHAATLAALLCTAALPLDAASVSVDATSTVRTVDTRHLGLNTNIWDKAGATPETVALLRACGVRFMRYPGGSLSDEYHWQTNRSFNNAWEWFYNTDAFIGVAKQVGFQAVITANYGTGTPEEAAAWVTYCNVTKAAGFKYWEIGNEIYGSWETDAQARPHDPFLYATRAKDYIAQMKAADGTIRIGVVVSDPAEEYANYTDHPVVNPRTGATHNGWNPVMLATLKSLGVTPDFVALHRYDGTPGQENDAVLLQKAATWATTIGNLRQQLTDYLGTAAAGVEILVTETNSVYSNTGKQTTSLVNALFLADSFCNLMMTEVDGVNWWGLRNSQEFGNNNSPSLYGWRPYGDYGIVSSATAGGSATSYEPYPTFYAFKLLARFARAGDTIIKTTTDTSLLAAFATKGTDGALRLLVINKSPTATQSTSIALNGFTPTATATTSSYGMVEDNNAKIGTGSTDLATGTITNAGTTFTTSFEPYSLTLLTFTPGTTTPPPPSTPPPPPSSGGGGGGGGGAVNLWFLAALGGLALARRRRA